MGVSWPFVAFGGGKTRPLRLSTKLKDTDYILSGVSWRRTVVAADPCVYCVLRAKGKTAEPMTKEHIIPVVNGGTDRWDNIVSAHRKCNSDRSAHPLLLYLIYARQAEILVEGVGSAKGKKTLRRRILGG